MGAFVCAVAIRERVVLAWRWHAISRAKIGPARFSAAKQGETVYDPRLTLRTA
jgi:hypothetical protein